MQVAWYWSPILGSCLSIIASISTQHTGKKYFILENLLSFFLCFILIILLVISLTYQTWKKERNRKEEEAVPTTTTHNPPTIPKVFYVSKARESQFLLRAPAHNAGCCSILRIASTHQHPWTPPSLPSLSFHKIPCNCSSKDRLMTQQEIW